MKHLIRSTNKPVSAEVLVPGSKSITNRALMLAALSDGVSELFNVKISDDTIVFIEALRSLGVAIILDHEDKSCILGGVNGILPQKRISIWCGDAGIALRFLLATCASSPGTYQFDASQQLRRRPIQSLLHLLCSQGAKVIPEDAQKMPFAILGSDGLLGGEFEIENAQAGQFVSALLMVAPYAKSPILIKTEELINDPFVEMTCAMMAEFGVLVRRMHHARFYVPVPQRYQAMKYCIEPDMTMASYFFAAAAITGGSITIQAINREQSKQADVHFISVLEKMGCIVMESPSGLTIKGPSELRGVNVDMRNFSDSFMALAAVAPFANSPTTITNISRVRLRKLDRIATLRIGLEKLGVKVESGTDWIKIYPSKPLPAIIDSSNDRHMVMAFSVIGLRVAGIEVEHTECVNKDYPEFFLLWEKFF